jgi:uncharacterized SAM-binding protein YcdF (DUF218 family)
MFTLKKLLGALLSPLTGGLLLALGLTLLAFRARSKRTAKRAKVGLGLLFALFWALGTTPVANLVLFPFERGAKPVLSPAELPGAAAVRWVVVLGGGHTTDLEWPALAELSAETIYRLVEGVRLHRALPGTELYLSGWGGLDPRTNAEAMADAAVALGADPRRIELARTPRDTGEEAQVLARFLHDRGEAEAPFLLVTSAAHMPRALRLMRGVGLDPIPAPAQAYTLGFSGWGREEGFRRFFPQARNYVKVERAVHETLGLLVTLIPARGASGGVEERP